MDPLSISASALTVIAALEATFRLIRSYCDAPAQLEAINDEISNLTATVTEVARVIEESRGTAGLLHDRVSHLVLSLTRIQDKARELEALFRSCVNRPSLVPGENKYSRRSWLKIKSKVQRLQAELRNARLDLSNALALFTASSAQRTEWSIQDISMTTKKTFDNQNTFAERFAEKHDQQRSKQEQFYADMLTQLGNLQLSLRTEKGHYGVGAPRYPTPSLESGLDAPRTSEYDKPTLQIHRAPTKPVQPLSLWDSQSVLSDDWATIGIRAELGNLSGCSRDCGCSCHLRRRLSTPRILDDFLGTLFIAYTGFPILNQKCDYASCRRRKNSSTSMIYQFPRWLIISWVIELKAKVTTMYGPEVSLRFNRVVDARALIFHYAFKGDVGKIKNLFEQGNASPSDARFDSGWTPLHYAIQYHQVDTCKLLLQAGGDPYLENEAPMTAADLALTIILGQSAALDIINGLRELFLTAALLEHWDFSNLHKIIFKIGPGDLQEELTKSTADLDALDANGRTPLSWAAQRGDVETVKLLLAYGADPNNRNILDMTPMHYAAQATNPICLRVLLDNGAMITRQGRGWNALHYVSCYHDDPTLVELLLHHGANINERTYMGKTALSVAVLHNQVKTAACLISQGADLDILDTEGQSPLSISIKFGHVEATKLLLRSGATHNLLSEGDDTLLHIVAKFPDVRSIRYLIENDVLDADTDLRNRDGRTARELLSLHNSDPEIAFAFQRLLSRLSERRHRHQRDLPCFDIVEDSDDDSSIDNFEDAVE